MSLVNFDVEIQIESALRSDNVTVFVGATDSPPASCTSQCPDHYMLTMAITPRPPRAWATLGDGLDREPLAAMGELMLIPPGYAQRGGFEPQRGLRRDIFCLFPQNRFEDLMGGPIEWTHASLKATSDIHDPNLQAATRRLAQEAMTPGMAAGGGGGGPAAAGAGPRARERGIGQVGSLGSGNHFLEVQAVEQVRDGEAARAFRLWPGQVCVMIHTGSRGLGHQVCADHVAAMGPAMARYGIAVPDRQLACAPVASPEGAAYLAAMAAAANYARANRQLLAQAARRAFGAVFPGAQLRLLYDVAHNLAAIETHEAGGRPRWLCVHRKGATRALPPGHPGLPAAYSAAGQPVLVPGSMGTGSYVLAGVAGGGAFFSACHGAGRRLSRHQALRRARGGAVRAELAAAGIAVRGASARGLAEEAPDAYKDVDAVVAVCEQAGLARAVARLRPVGVVKG